MKVADLYEYAARTAEEFTCFPDDDEARDRVERAWLEIGADYFGTLRAVIANADAQAGAATSRYDAMIRVANAARKVAEEMPRGRPAAGLRTGDRQRSAAGPRLTEGQSPLSA